MAPNSCRLSQFWILLIALLLGGCSSGVNRYALVEDSLRAGDPQRAAQIIERAEREYGSESRVLYLMDRGMTLHLAGEYGASNAVLNEAEEQLERLYTRHVRTETAAFLTSDAKLPYEGDPYEQTMINVVKALNFALLGSWGEALVEARRLDHRLNVLTDQTGPKDGYRDDPFARYLSGILFESAGELNDAFIAYRKAYELYGSMRSWSGVSMPSTLRSDLLRVTDALHLVEEHNAYLREFADVAWQPYAETKALGQLIVITSYGRAPRKEDVFIDVPISLDALNLVLLAKAYGRHTTHSTERRAAESVLYGLNGHIIRVAIPRIVRERQAVLRAAVTARTDGATYTAEAQPVNNMTALAERALSDRLPRISVKAVARAVVKYGLAEGVGRGAQAAAGKDAGPLVGLLVNVLAKAIAVASEEADTRSWRTLPHEMSVARLWVPPGTYEIRTDYTGSSTVHPVRSQAGSTVSVKSGETKLLTERVIP